MTENFFDLHIVSGIPRKLTSHRMLEAEALLLGCSIRRTRSVSFDVVLSDGTTFGFLYSRLRDAPKEAISTARDKTLTKRHLKAKGLPVAEGGVFEADQIEDAVAFAGRIGYPVVVKPAGGRQGRGVYADLWSEPALRTSFLRSAKAGFTDTRLIVEKHINGSDFRVFSTTKDVFSVVQRLPAFVTGDGTSTISELVAAKNERRKFNPRYFSTQLDANNDPELLAQQGFEVNSVPEAGTHVLLSSTANLSRGGESRECFESTHPSIFEFAKAAIRSIPGLEYGGVDIIMEDPTLPVDKQNFAIIEINGTPMLLMHPFPGTGKPRNVPRMILQEALHARGVAFREIPDPPGRIFAHLEITGKVTRVGYRKWFRKKLAELELNGTVRNRGKAVEAIVEGSAYRISHLNAMCLKGPVKATPSKILCKPITEKKFDQKSEAFTRRVSASLPASPSHIAPMQGLGLAPAEYIVALESDKLSSSVAERARALFLDALGAMMIGAQHPEARRFHEMARSRHGSGPVPVPGTPYRADAETAALVSGAFTQIHDYNDGHRVSMAQGGMAHPGRVVIPVALAEAVETRASTEELLAAVVIGYDIGCRLRGRASSGERVATPSNSYAAAAVSARLHGLDPKQVKAALGLAGFFAPARHGRKPPSTALQPFRNGMFARSGILASRAAMFGQLGPDPVFDRTASLPLFLDRPEDHEVMNAYVKPWPTCRMTHSATEALICLRQDMGFDANDVLTINVSQLPKGMYVARRKPMRNITYKRAQFNLYYCLARVVVDGWLTPSQFQGDLMTDERVAALIDRINITPDDSLSGSYPFDGRPAVVKVSLVDGRQGQQRVDLPFGDPTRFPTIEQSIDKFAANAEPLMGSERARKIATLILEGDFGADTSFVLSG